MLPLAGVRRRILHHAMQRDDFAAGVDGDDSPAFDAFDATFAAEIPGLHEGVADEVEIACELEFPVSAVARAEDFVM